MKLTQQEKLIEAAKLDGWTFTKKDDKVYRNKFKFGALRNGKLLTFQKCHTTDRRDEYMGRLEEYHSTEWDFDSLSDVLRELPKYDSSYDAVIPLIQKQEPWIWVSVEQHLTKNGFRLLLATPSQLLDALLAAKGFEV